MIEPDPEILKKLVPEAFGPPMSDAQFRKYTLHATIFPTIERWGFRPHFHVEQTFPAKQKAVYDRVLSLLRNKGAIIAMVGPRGLGKTTIAAQLALDAAWANYESSLVPGPRRYRHVIYRKTAKLVAYYKPLFADFGSTDTKMLLDQLEYFCNDQELVVIDELHDCDDQKIKTRMLTDLVDRRYANNRDTILISNQTGEQFSETIGDSILSRLGEHGDIIECKWGSFRQ